ncbi:MAG: ADP-ribose pyrophosphatase [Alphaproteobacteria bacterium CG_4_10_14_0_2_um_filter_63_37]|nr:MAG: ADP-ribose pyrophosphatase [Proteobacteria bacterium CG1_02_64_396]PJA24124.1 MAG: ADP-ribose pyrophosphatase [Alphaproteobacteria bacterium CG_4_10_14_0_2_um_filter_63_37]
MTCDFDLLVFVGRFQPFHNSHAAIVQTALTKGRQVLVLIGSANAPRSTRNPFTAREREVMIRESFPLIGERLAIAPIRDYPYMDDLWLRQVQDAVKSAAPDAHRIGLIGHLKDETSYYLRMFPQWQLVEMPNIDDRSSTEIRTLLFEPHGEGTRMVLQSAVPAPCLTFLTEFRRLPQFAALVEEYRFLAAYKKQFADYPYPPTFVTVDAVVIHSGHLLVVERKAMPGKGMYALPGGFVGQDERLLDAAIRELKEETRLKLPAPVLKGSIKGSRVFDDPHRSQRGRTITHAFHFEFPGGPLPPVKGGDDAAKAKWLQLADFYALDGAMFEDHWHIVTAFVGGV